MEKRHEVLEIYFVLLVGKDRKGDPCTQSRRSDCRNAHCTRHTDQCSDGWKKGLRHREGHHRDGCRMVGLHTGEGTGRCRARHSGGLGTDRTDGHSKGHHREAGCNLVLLGAS